MEIDCFHLFRPYFVYPQVHAGSHRYPGRGVYLLKFDNSYSLWRSKTLYYRVYYTRWHSVTSHNCHDVTADQIIMTSLKDIWSIDVIAVREICSSPDVRMSVTPVWPQVPIWNSVCKLSRPVGWLRQLRLHTTKTKAATWWVQVH